MPSKSKPLTKTELAAYEAKRNLAEELLQSVREMKAGQVHVVSSPVIEARRKTGLSQSQFAALMGVSVRTLQGWEQGRKQPSGAARTLLAIASTNPKAVLAVAGRSFTVQRTPNRDGADHARSPSRSCASLRSLWSACWTYSGPVSPSPVSLHISTT